MATTINAQTIADPYQISISREMIGGGGRSSNGTYMLDYASTTLKRVVTMSWRLITAAERTSILARIAECIAASRALVLPDGTSITVFYNPEVEPVETMVKDAVGYKYNFQAAFVEA